MEKFKENLNTVVFTTKYVLNLNSPILYVYHYEDGSWQFNGKEKNIEEDDYKVLSLGEIIGLDETVQEIGGLPLGFEAFREAKGKPWKIVSGN